MPPLYWGFVRYHRLLSRYLCVCVRLLIAQRNTEKYKHMPLCDLKLIKFMPSVPPEHESFEILSIQSVVASNLRKFTLIPDEKDLKEAQTVGAPLNTLSSC